MKTSDLPDFSAMLDATCAMLSRGQYRPNESSTMLFFRVLQGFPIDAVRTAFSAHMADPVRGRFPPVPADIVEQINRAIEQDGRPGSEEAWTIAMKASDEHDSVVWSDDISRAYGIASELLSHGDRVGARMAFKESYERIVGEERAAGRRPKWSVSLGGDPARRDAATRQALQMGIVGSDVLPPPGARPSIGLDAVLLIGATRQEASTETKAAMQKALEKMKATRAQIAGQSGPDAVVKVDERTSRMKREAAEKVSRYAAENDNTRH